jgi:hypothetical protein
MVVGRDVLVGAQYFPRFGSWKKVRLGCIPFDYGSRTCRPSKWLYGLSDVAMRAGW